MKFTVALIFQILLFAPLSHGYILAVPKTQGPINYDGDVRILLSGRGTDLGRQPQLAALGSAQLYRINFPSDQVVLLSVFEDEDNEKSLSDSGWVLLVNNDLHLETQSALAEIEKFKKIRSLEFFGHNSPSLGTQADGLGFRFDFRGPEVAALKSHFTNDSFAFIHGCNSGWIIAQDLAKAWQIPVASSFTETRFERLHSDGHFYIAENSKAPNKQWARKNEDLGTDCDDGGCLRMRPAYSRYKGKWGDFDGPLLSHYKFFCQLDVKDCEKRMARSLFGFVAERSLKPSATREEFREVAKQFLCPVYKDRKITEDCLSELAKFDDGGLGNPYLSYVVGNTQLLCTLRECKAKMMCTDHNCTISDRSSKKSKTLTDEYLHYLNGFEYLQEQGQ